MGWKHIIIVITALIALVIIILLIVFQDAFLDWLNSRWLDILIAAILAIIAGLIIEVIYRKYAPKSKFSKTTLVMKPRKKLAKLILPDNNHLTITQYERIFGREDFVGVLIADQLLFIGKKHFKLTRLDDGFYIEDLNTKNSTRINGEDIKGLGKIKLKNNDRILLADTLNLLYSEEDV